MGYYFRVFCTSDTVPKLSDVLEWVRARGVQVSVDPPEAESRDWGDTPVDIYYQEGQPPFLAELNRREGDDSLAAQEITEFLDMLNEVKKGRKRDRVIQHLHDTKFIVACQIPASGFENAGFHALDVFMAYFVVHSGGLVQADGQGFYEMGKISVELAA